MVASQQGTAAASMAPRFSSAPDSLTRERSPVTISLVLLTLLMASIPLENVTVLPAIGSISRLLGLVATGAALLDAAMGLGFRKPSLAHLPLAAFVVWSAWTYFWSFNRELTYSRITTNIQLLLLVWLIWQGVRNLGQLRLALAGFFIGNCCAAILTVVNAREMVAVDDIRYSGAGADPNELGLMMVLSLPMAYYLFRTAGNNVERLLCLLPVPLCIYGVFLTVSRGAFITTVVALVSISIWHITSAERMRWAPIICGAILLCIGFAFMPKVNLERIETIQTEISTGRVGKRTRIWKVGLELFQSRPLVGIGAASFGFAAEPYLGRDLVAHNVYVSVLTETGLIGALCFAIVLLTLYRVAWTLNGHERALWLLLLVIWCIGVLSLTFEYKKPTWVLFGLLIATAGESSQVRLVRPGYRQVALNPVG